MAGQENTDVNAQDRGPQLEVGSELVPQAGQSGFWYINLIAWCTQAQNTSQPTAPCVWV